MKSKFSRLTLTLFYLIFLTTQIAEARIIYVAPVLSGDGSGTSWANASGDLQRSIEDANSGDTIWVKEGIYTPIRNLGNTSGSNNRFFGLNKHLKIFGGFKGNENFLEQRDWVNNKTILSGDFSNNNDINSSYRSTSNKTDDLRRILVITGNLNSAEVDGFYLMHTYNNSNTNVNYDAILNYELGGVVVNSATGITLRNLNITRHYATKKSGLNIVNSTVNLENIYLKENYGGEYVNNFERSSITAKDIFIEKQYTSGYSAGLNFSFSQKSVVNNLVIKNIDSTNFGALDIYWGDTVKINRAQIYNNKLGTYSPIFVEMGKLIISNALVYGNSTKNRGTVISPLSSSSLSTFIKVINSTFANNISYSTSNKYSIYNSNSYQTIVELYNSIVYDSTYDLYNRKFNVAKQNYSYRAFNAYVNQNNLIGGDPFLDYKNHNYQLQIGSIARNGADSTFLLNVLRTPNLVNELDVFGNPRVNLNGKLDIGAVEDTLIDALLSPYKIKFELIQNSTTKIYTAIQNHPFEKLVIKAGFNPSNTEDYVQLNVFNKNDFKNEVNIHNYKLIYFELWGIEPNGKETLLAIRNKNNKEPFTISINPNPAINHLRISVSDRNIQSIKVFSITGQLVKTLTQLHQSNFHQIDVSDLTPGTYVLTIDNGSIVESKRFIKQ